MSYIPLEQHPKSWIFRHQSLPINELDSVQIKPMTSPRAITLWGGFISNQVDHPDFFKKGDWAFDPNTWSNQGPWEATWDSEEPDLPAQILEHLDWANNTTVYYCNDRHHVIETNWGVFKRCWKNFLFMDDGSLLIGKKRDQVVQFLSNGTYRIGTK